MRVDVDRERTTSQRSMSRSVVAGLAAAVVLAGLPGTASAAPSTPSLGRRCPAGRRRRCRAGRSAPDPAGCRPNGGGDGPGRGRRRPGPARGNAGELPERAGRPQTTPGPRPSRRRCDLAAARADVAAFARSSYMTGTTSPGLQALLTSADPTQMLERAVLLEAAGSRRSDVLTQVAVAQGLAADAATARRPRWPRPPRSSRKPPPPSPRPTRSRAKPAGRPRPSRRSRSTMQARLQEARTTLVEPAAPADPRAAGCRTAVLRAVGRSRRTRRTGIEPARS